MSRIFLLLVSLVSYISLSSQNIAEGFFTSEAATTTLDGKIVISIKKYNPTPEQIKNAARPPKNAPMTYLNAPFEATNISMYSKDFESKIYLLNNDGTVAWDKTIGYSNKSVASPVKAYKGFIYTGATLKESDKVTIQKIGSDGKTAWQVQLDSLENVNDIYVDDEKVIALVSFDASKRVDHKDGTYSVNTYAIYFQIQLDINTGKKIKQEYQAMGNWLSSIGFSNPFIGNNDTYYLNNSDSAIFLRFSNQQGATVVTENMSPENKIIVLTAGKGSYHLLTSLAKGKVRRVYHLITDFYADEKKYQSELPVDHDPMAREYIFRNAGDSVITVISSSKHITLLATDKQGKTTVIKKIADATFPVAIGEASGKVYIVQVKGREKPGVPGKISINYLQ